MDVILIFVQCSPTSTLWDPKPGAKCWSREFIKGYVYFALSNLAHHSLINHTMWAVLEGNAIIIAACIPGLRPFIKYIRRKQYLRKPNHPAPLNLRKERHLDSDISALPSPVSVRRMEPRSSGSVSSVGLQLPNHKAYRQNSLAPIMSNTGDVEVGVDEGREEGRFVNWQGFVVGDEDREKKMKISDLDKSVGEGADGRD
ncbi:MAG: hypothetical protein Q9179_004540 [Wetmoreana sp. 5 TL-2023]